MNELPKPEYIWFNGAVRPWQDATVHVWSEVVLRAASVFEGLRGYWHQGESRHYLVHLDAHVQRMAESARVVRFPRVITVAEVRKAISETISALGYQEDIYLRPTLYLERGRYSIGGAVEDCGFFMPIFPAPREQTIGTGITCQVSSWRHADDNSAPPRVKAAANYYNLRLARMEATMNGYGEAILLNTAGRVAETGGASVFLVRGGQVITPHLASSILESITRRCLIELLTEAGLNTTERAVERTELYLADELFLTGTLCEVTPVIGVDGHPVGNGQPGPLTRILQERYYEACQAGQADARGWLTAGPVLA